MNIRNRRSYTLMGLEVRMFFFFLPLVLTPIRLISKPFQIALCIWRNAIMPISQPKKSAAEALASLYVDALRQGQSLWFRVASGSMSPTLRVGDEVRIEPAT